MLPDSKLKAYVWLNIYVKRGLIYMLRHTWEYAKSNKKGITVFPIIRSTKSMQPTENRRKEKANTYTGTHTRMNVQTDAYTDLFIQSSEGT